MSAGRKVRVYDYVRQPFERVRAALLADVRRTLSRATTVAGERAERVASGLRVNVAGIEIGKEIDIEVLGSSDTLDPATGLPCETRIELQWTAVGKAALFPTMQAELVLHSLSATETQLDLTGTYEPPLGALGLAIDALVGHRVVEASVHQFIVDVAQRLTRDLSPNAEASTRSLA